MSYWVDKLEKLIEEQKKQEPSLAVEGLPNIPLFEFYRREMAVEIYSEVLVCNLWLCSN